MNVLNSSGGCSQTCSSSGFTLIEILVAISVLAIALVMILQLFSGGLNSARIGEEYTRGIFHAREKMEEILLLKDLEAGEAAGAFEDGIMWKARIVQVGPSEEEVETFPLDTYEIQVSVRWPEGMGEREFEIRTLKSVPKDQSLFQQDR